MIHTPLNLPCGAEIPNRLCKAAMTEGLATPAGEPTPALNQLYGLWSDGGAGLLLSGNVQIDGDHLERPGNVIIDGEPSAAMRVSLEAWAAAGTRAGNHFWAQISHAGRQCQKIVNPHPKAPSAVKLGLPGGQFGEPDPMTEDDIEAVIAGFARCARVVVDAGFTGVQLHAAHGYLLSQFLSPRSNQREDQWGARLRTGHGSYCLAWQECGLRWVLQSQFRSNSTALTFNEAVLISTRVCRWPNGLSRPVWI